jgi:hypothetical protein
LLSVSRTPWLETEFKYTTFRGVSMIQNVWCALFEDHGEAS